MMPGPRDNKEKTRRPYTMGRPCARIDEYLDHCGHEQERKRGVARCKSKYEQNWKQMLREGGEMCSDDRVKQRNSVFVFEERDRAILQLPDLPAFHLGSPGIPKYRGGEDSRCECDKPIGDRFHPADRPSNERCESRNRWGMNMGAGSHCNQSLGSAGRVTLCTTPAAMSPARLATISKSAAGRGDGSPTRRRSPVPPPRSRRQVCCRRTERKEMRHLPAAASVPLRRAWGGRRAHLRRASLRSARPACRPSSSPRCLRSDGASAQFAPKDGERCGVRRVRPDRAPLAA